MSCRCKNTMGLWGAECGTCSKTEAKLQAQRLIQERFGLSKQMQPAAMNRHMIRLPCDQPTPTSFQASTTMTEVATCSSVVHTYMSSHG